MKKFEVKLRTITPTFMYGADGETPEIRSQSIKGLLRFWYRALSGQNDIDKLHREEGKIFGSTDEKIGSAKVNVRVKNGFIINRDKISGTEKRKDWQRVSKSDNNFSGTNYLYYSIKMGSKVEGEKIFKEAILPGHEFTILLSSEEQEALEKAVCALWCLVYFGGIGSRSRRTAGSLEVLTSKNVDFNNEKLPSFFLEAKDAKDVVDFLMDNFEKMQNFVKTKETNKFSNLYGATIDVKPYEAWNYAVEGLGNNYKNFRAQNKREKIGFGLPVIGLPVIVINKKIERRASPLILKVLKSNQKQKYFGLAVRLQGLFYPNLNISTEVIDKFTENLKWEGAELK